MRLARPALAALSLLATGCAMVGSSGGEFEDVDTPEATISVEEVAHERIHQRDLADNIRFLAADERRGRATPSPGLDRAAAWIGEQFQRAGLEPAGDAGGYLQYWPYPASADSAVLAPNVVGRLSGNDLTRAGEYVIVMAHFDHLGVGEPGEESDDSTYNGADDNASGVAALVATVQAFSSLPDPPARPVLFLAVSGKEDGLLGSRWYAEHPTIAMENAVAVLDVDMIGRNHGDSIGVVGHSYSTLGSLIERVARATGSELGITADPEPGRELARQSDFLPFARRGIPSVRLFSGFHDDWHTPEDEADRIDFRKVERVARLLFLTVHHLADSEIEPEWTASGRAELVGTHP